MYLAIDVETANPDYSSICQVGIVKFEEGEIVNEWSTLVNPEAYFDPFNTSIHGIDEDAVKHSPTFDAIYDELIERINGQITVHHTSFDKVAINRACLAYDLNELQPKWLDSAKIVRRAWKEFAQRGYGLANVSEYLGIKFQHHDALEDAKAAGLIVHNACVKTGLTAEEWLKRVSKPISRARSSFTINLDGNPEGLFYGENIVFTGTLFMPRKEVAKIASDLGCNVSNSVTRKTTMLVVGIQDAHKLAGFEKSSKHRKAEDLMQKGQQIRILSEKDFIALINSEDEGGNSEKS